MKYLGFISGALFALTIFNPNFTKRRSWYLRKFTPFLWGGIGWMFFGRYCNDQIVFTYARMNDYFPMEVKRALRDKDFRHLALFDLE